MTRLDYFWHSNPNWYEKNEYGIDIIKKDAPPEAQESYKHYLEQLQSPAL